MTTQTDTRISPEEYLARERRAEYKSEYSRGRIVAMTGASREHSLICVNLGGELCSLLRGRPCETYPSDMRVKVDASGLYTYPDLVVVCGEPRFEDAHVETLLNPTVLAEVLSASSEAYDRGAKFAQYRRLPSLQAYVLVAQDRALVECFARHGDEWLLREAIGLDAELVLQSIDCRIPLRLIYERLEPAEDDIAAGAR